MKKEIFIGSLILSASFVPIISVVSCSNSGAETTQHAGTQLDDQIKAATEAKEEQIREAQDKIDKFIIDSNKAISPSPSTAAKIILKEPGNTLADITGVNFDLAYFNEFTTRDGLLGKVIGAEFLTTNSINVTIQISSTVEGTLPKTYNEILNLDINSLTISPSELESEKQRSLLLLNQEPTASEITSWFNTPDISSKLPGEVMVTDFVPFIRKGDVQYSVSAVGNPTANGELLVSVYAFSPLLDYLNKNRLSGEPEIMFENRFDVLINGFRSGPVSNVSFDPIRWQDITNYSNYEYFESIGKPLAWTGGIHRFAMDQSISLFYNIAEDLGWNRTVEKPIPDSQGNYSTTIPFPNEDANIQATDALSYKGWDDLVKLQPQNGNKYENRGTTPFMTPLGDQGRPGPVEMDWSGLYHPHHVDVNAPTIARLGKPWNQISSITYGDLKYVSSYSNWLDWHHPGILFTELEQSGSAGEKLNPRTGALVNTTAYEWFISSPTDFVRHDYPIVSLKDSSKYINLIEGAIKKMKDLGTSVRTIAQITYGDRKVSEDVIDAIEFFSKLTMSDQEIREFAIQEFNDINQSQTYYWPAFEIFMRGITDIPYEFRGDRSQNTWNRDRKDNIAGFSSINEFPQLMQWTSGIKNKVGAFDEDAHGVVVPTMHPSSDFGFEQDVDPYVY